MYIHDNRSLHISVANPPETLARSHEEQTHDDVGSYLAGERGPPSKRAVPISFN